jgi:putative ABC transport system substrate-binding protein
MRRRTVVLGAAASAVLAAAPVRAQQPGRTYRIGVLTPVAGLAGAPYLAALREQLGKHGFAEGRNLGIDVRVLDSFGSRAAAAAAQELIARKPDAILSMGTTLTLGALASTSTIPIVFTWVADPLGSGLLKNLARPDRNATGVTNRSFELTAKRVELVRALLPAAKRLAMATNYFDPVLEQAMTHAQRAAEQVGIELVRVEVGASWANGVELSKKAETQAMLALTPFRFFGLSFAEEDVVRQSIEQRFPVTFSNVETVEAGGLASYGTRLTDDVRRAADLLARVLAGEKPQELSVDQAARFELAINVKTARAIGLTVPQSLLVRADRVIE